MNFSPAVYAELFRQAAFISALIAGFSFAFVGIVLTNASPKRVVGWTAAFSIIAAAGLVVCSLGWTLSAPRMAALALEVPTNTPFQLPELFRSIHRCLSMTFVACFFLFLTSLALSGWIRSRLLGIISTTASLTGSAMAVWILSHFVR